MRPALKNTPTLGSEQIQATAPWHHGVWRRDAIISPSRVGHAARQEDACFCHAKTDAVGGFDWNRAGRLGCVKPNLNARGQTVFPLGEAQAYIAPCFQEP